ncbi:MAG: hypothetical protein A2138_17010 [Deltaproteobacteria bacterium RBG_16_71_12]|nr:MAG: hypothetical protein A2138_17010 [Deltaproteobacteria bacterium RBG_16_71_12]
MPRPCAEEMGTTSPMPSRCSSPSRPTCAGLSILLAATTTGRPLFLNRRATSRSSLVTPARASTTWKMTSASSMASCVCSRTPGNISLVSTSSSSALPKPSPPVSMMMTRPSPSPVSTSVLA